MGLKKPSIWEKLLNYAKWTASPHNIQPWKLKIKSEKEADLLCDPSRLIPGLDTSGAFTIAGFAMFVDNLDIAAREDGFQVTAEYNNLPFYGHKTCFKFGTLKITKTNKKSGLDRELILKRQTSRLRYNDRKIPRHIQSDLSQIAKKFGHQFSFSSEKNLVDWALNLNCETMFFDLDDNNSREELDKWIRYSKKEALDKRDGLWSYCMRFSDMTTWLFFKQHWLFKIKLVRSFARKYYLNSMKGSSTIGWIRGPFSSRKDWLIAGQMLNRIWLHMTKNGVSLHPFGSIITNNKSHLIFKEKMRNKPGKGDFWLIMRLGFGNKPPRSQRLDNNDLMVN